MQIEYSEKIVTEDTGLACSWSIQAVGCMLVVRLYFAQWFLFFIHGDDDYQQVREWKRLADVSLPQESTRAFFTYLAKYGITKRDLDAAVLTWRRQVNPRHLCTVT